MRPRRWNVEQLEREAKNALSYRQLMMRLGLRPAGGNYLQIRKYLKLHGIPTDHFRCQGWSKGRRLTKTPLLHLEAILVVNSSYQSYKLKKRLFRAGLKAPRCELCGWAEQALDGRIPLEIDHINGLRTDNRLENLRILCPNCHSLQPTHRGLNIRKRS